MASRGSKSPSTPPTNKSKRSRQSTTQSPTSSPTRRSRRSPKPRSSHEFVQDSSATKTTPLWPDDDVIVLLRAAVDFKSKTGKAPTESQTLTLFDSVKGSLSLPDLSPKVVWNKLYRLRRNYRATIASPLPDSATDHERLVAQLSDSAWGHEQTEEMDGDADVDADDGSSSSGSFHYFARYVEECLKEKNLTIPPEALESVEPSVKKALDDKLRKFVQDGLRRQVIKCNLDKEIFDLLLRVASK